MQLNWKLILDPINPDPVDKRAYIRLEETSNMLYSLAGSILLEPNKVDLYFEVSTNSFSWLSFSHLLTGFPF